MFVYSFHAAAGPAHNAFSDNEIHDPDNKLVHQGEQTCVGVCKSFVRVRACLHAHVRACVCVHVCMFACCLPFCGTHAASICPSSKGNTAMLQFS